MTSGRMIVMGKPPKPPIQPPPTLAIPVVKNATFTLAPDAAPGDVVGTMTATGNPTAWKITAGNDGSFAINNSGVISVLDSSKTYSLTVAAINTSGTGTGMGTIIVARGTLADPWAALDGRAVSMGGAAPGALSAGFTNPTLLNAYGGSRIRVVGGSYLITDAGRKQPPWMVAGVDYPVGCPTAVGAFSAAKIAMSGSSFTSAFDTEARVNQGADLTLPPRALFQNATSCTFDGWDLTGVRFEITGTTPPMSFTNCQMGGGTSNWQYYDFVHEANIITSDKGGGIRYCTFDFGQSYETNVTSLGKAASFGLLGGNTFTCEYCYFTGAAGNHLSDFVGTGGGTLTIRYNYYDNVWFGLAWLSNVTAASNSGGNTVITMSPDLGLGATQPFSIDKCAAFPALNGVSYTITTNLGGGQYLTNIPWPGATFTAKLGYLTASTDQHMNYLQNNNQVAAAAPVTYIVNFNTTHQTTSGAQGFQMDVSLDANTGANKALFTGQCSNNTILAAAIGGTGGLIAAPRNSGSPIPQDTVSMINCVTGANFCDVASIIYYGGATWSGNWTLNPNINMATGATFTP